MDIEIQPPSSSFMGEVFLKALTIEAVFGILALIILLLCSAMISGSETAFFSLTPNDVSKLKRSDKRSHKKVLQVTHNSEKLLATILVVNNFVNVGIVLLSTFITHSLVDFTQAPVLGFIIEVVAITFVLLLFGEIIPKIFASQYAFVVSLRMAGILQFLSRVFAPINGILISSTSFVNKRLRKHVHQPTINDLSQALELTSDDDISEDKDILEGIVRFGSISVDEIMKPRIDVVSLQVGDSFSKVLQVINDYGFSRIPVYNDSFDDVTGILYAKDMIPNLHKGQKYEWNSLVRPPYFVPENKKIDDLLQEFQKEKVHMAIVVDEYGGTSGIITLEDILEEIVGDIVDEFDDDSRFFTRIDDKAFIFDGKTPITFFEKHFNLADNYFDHLRGDADTLAGLLLEIKGEFLSVQESIHEKGFTFTVEALDSRRIHKIKVTLE